MPLAPSVPLQVLDVPWLRQAEVEVRVLRLDLLDVALSGNKWFKLSGYLQWLQQVGAKGLLSVGGPHSNHLHALAAAGQRLGIPCVGLLRGAPQDTPTVRDLQAFGMQLHWLSYGEYRHRYRADFWAHWRARYPDYLGIPEGGSGWPGIFACKDIASLVPEWTFDGWWLGCGTGATLAGIVLGDLMEHTVYGALAGPLRHQVPQQVAAWLAEAGVAGRRPVWVEACRRGFGRADAQLQAFMTETEQLTGLPLEPVYTAKALLALREWVTTGQVPAGSRLVFVHTGGLQGRRQIMGASGASQGVPA